MTDYINWIFLMFFWIGILTMTVKDRNVLMERVASFRTAAKTRSSNALKKLESFKTQKQQNAMETELAESLAYIKNISILGSSGSTSAEYLMEEISDITVKLKPAFLDMARYLHVNDKLSAGDVLFSYVGTDSAKDIGRFLAGWEDIPPEDLLQTVDAYQSALRSERLTRKKRRDEMISDLIYFPVVMNCMVVLLNFVYVAYFLEQKEALDFLF